MSNSEAISLIKKIYKPGLTLPIFMTIIGMILLWGIFMDLSDGNYSRMGILVVSFGASMLVIGACWASYYFRMLQYKREVREYKENSDAYEW